MASNRPQRAPAARPGHGAAVAYKDRHHGTLSRTSGPVSREPIATLLAPLPRPLRRLLLPVLLPCWLLALVVMALVGGILVKPLETAAGLAAWGAFTWLVLAFLGMV